MLCLLSDNYTDLAKNYMTMTQFKEHFLFNPFKSEIFLSPETLGYIQVVGQVHQVEQDIEGEDKVDSEDMIDLEDKVGFEDTIDLEDTVGFEDMIDLEDKVGFESKVDLEDKVGLEGEVDFEDMVGLEGNVEFEDKAEGKVDFGDKLEVVEQQVEPMGRQLKIGVMTSVAAE